MTEETTKTPEPAGDDDQFADSLSDQGVPPSVLFSPVHVPTAAAVPPMGESNLRPEPRHSDQVAPSTSSVAHAARTGAASNKQQAFSGTSAKQAADKPVLAVAKAAYDSMAPLATSPILPTRALADHAGAEVIDMTMGESEKAQRRESPKRRRITVPVIPISSIETQVCRAARLVAHELENGGWPEVTPGARRQAAVALEEFAKTIFLPNLLQQQVSQSHPSNERVFLATMMALREVLTQNAERILAMKEVPRQGNEDNDTAPGSKRRKRRDQEEERQYMAQLFGTGVVYAAIQSAPEAEPYMSCFSHMIQSYDTGQDDFCSCMGRMDGRHQGATPNNKVLPSEENVAWKVSYNRARELHPVVRRNRQRAEHQSGKEAHVIEVPSPNAVYVSMVEQKSER